MKAIKQDPNVTVSKEYLCALMDGAEHMERLVSHYRIECDRLGLALAKTRIDKNWAIIAAVACLLAGISMAALVLVLS